MVRIYHNNRCSKSRSAVQILEEHNLNFEIIKYLDQVPSFDELKQLVKKLGVRAEDLVRKNESIYKEQFKGLEFSEEEWILTMCEYPILIERPIVEFEEKAIVARPPEVLEQFLKEYGA